MGKKANIGSLGVDKKILDDFSKAVLYNKGVRGFVKSTVEKFMVAYTEKTISNFKEKINEQND